MKKTSSPDISFRPAGIFEETRFEKLHAVIFDNAKQASLAVAQEIATLIRQKQAANATCVLGLATGSSPISVYEELVRMHQEEGLQFYNVISFNLDEYFPMKKENIQSYHYFMQEHLFSHIDIHPDNIYIPDGEIDESEVRNYCIAYEKKIKEAGGIDFQLLGIGRTGHIGFNEPGSHLNSLTRSVNLDYLTRYDASDAFLGIENVPRKAITMGISTVKHARRIVLMAWGQNKSSIIRRAVEEDVTSNVPATYLQEHQNTTIVLDNEATSELTRIRTPWLVGSCEWTKKLREKAVLWLCEKKEKSVLQMTEADYNEYGMSEMLSEISAYDLNIEVFNKLQNSITGWPGGKPNADDSNRPERAEPGRKRVIVFSPHPDDDMISMGGTIDRLVTQGHDVHIAYQTSGNIGVSNNEALKFLEVATGLGDTNQKEHLDSMIQQVKNADADSKNSPEIIRLKGLIRQKESLGATRYLGVADDKVYFLNLPFYQTGTIKKRPIGNKDIEMVSELIERIQPHQIYAAEDVADPHGTHRICLDIILRSVQSIKSKPFMKDCWLWLYRGAWHDWDIHEIDMAIPMSPDQVVRKRKAIFFHQTQKDAVMFLGDDLREFWMRAADLNRDTARKYRELGLADYAAMEAFKRYYF